ncbi:MAG TPA: helix-turn-helix transcriptional regulator [Ktedonobacteraceae bacterium]
MYVLQAKEWQESMVVEEQISTRAIHMACVERVILTMHRYVAEPLSLEDMADVACLSPYYFNRIFHQRIGIPPGEFFATLRLNAAKRLLLTTEMSVTEICFAIGYNGLGSFTTRFTQLVGVSPGRLRYLVHNEPVTLAAVQKRVIELADKQPPSPWRISGHIYSERPMYGNIFVGLFPKSIPQGRPVSCTLLTTPGPFQLAPVPRGKYYILVAALPDTPDPMAYLLPTSPVQVGVFGPLVIAPEWVWDTVEIRLRPLGLTDPPIISALPYL